MRIEKEEETKGKMPSPGAQFIAGILMQSAIIAAEPCSSIDRKMWTSGHTFHGTHGIGAMNQDNVDVVELKSFQRTANGFDDVLLGQAALLGSAVNSRICSIACHMLGGL